MRTEQTTEQVWVAEGATTYPGEGHYTRHATREAAEAFAAAYLVEARVYPEGKATA